jgi:hydrophobe/amphiphile efflux-1 (HAE1) family protein
MNFSAWSIRNPVAPLLGFFLLMILGWQSFNALPITRFPNIDMPLVAVTVAQSGAAPSEMESQVTKEIEDAVAGLTGVKNVTSSVTDGLSTTVIEFRMEVPTDDAVQDVKDAVDQIRGELPGDVEAPIVTKIDVEGQAIMTFSVSAPGMTIEELSWFVDDTVKRALQGRPGIGRITRVGGADREIRVELDPVKLAAYGVTAQQVSAQVAQTNVNLGSGQMDLGSGQQVIRTLGDAGTVEALGAMTIALPSGRQVRLSDLGTVLDSYEELKSFTRVDGQETVSFLVFRAKGASEVSVAELTLTQLDRVRAENPDVRIEMIDDQVYYTRGNYESAIHTLIEGALLAVLVVLAFLRNWRATLISAVALPLSAIPTFWLMDMLGFSLNLVSFLALTLATGILVDDAIVEIENIARHIRMGKSPYRAAIDAADEIGLAVIATTSTIVAVFVPVSFMPGIPGQYFRQFGLTVAIAVIFSLLVARLITPMMAAYLMRAKDAAHEEKDGPFMRGYLWAVKKSTRVWRVPGMRWLRIPNYYFTVVAAIGVVIYSVVLMLQVPGGLFPPEDESRIAISVELPAGSSLEDTDRTTEAMRQAIADVDGVARVIVVGGSTPLGDRDIRRASFTVVLDRLDNGLARKLSDLGQKLPIIGPMLPEAPVTGRIRPQAEIEVEVFDRLRAVPDIRAFKLGGPGGGGRQFSYNILSNDEADLTEAVQKIEAAVRDEPMLRNVLTESALLRPELQITPLQEEAARLGVTSAAIAATVRVATIGDVDQALGKLKIDNRLVPIRVQLDDSARENIARIAALKVPTASGASVPLSAVARIELAEGPSVVERLNRQRVATLGADLAPGFVVSQAAERFEAIIAGLDLPDSVQVTLAGDAEIEAELNTSFVNAMILGVLLMMMVLILLFHSVIQPITIIFSLLLSVGGVAAALILSRYSLSMPVMIGMLMLMGIVAKNAILLIDFAIEMRVRGMNRFAAVVEAGHKRARPIVMTSIAMSAGMLPSALGVGEGGAFRAPMATAVIGGIIVSTVLSLVVVPSFYLIMDDLSRGLSWIFSWVIGPKEAEPEEPPAHVLAERIERGDESLALLGARVAALEEALPGGTKRTKLHVAE